jgi:putative spermidine/putrescine transport system permease protein
LAFLFLPNFVVIPVSFNPIRVMDFPPRGFVLTWYQDYLDQPGWVAATITSLQVAVCVSLLSVALGSLAAYGIVRGSFPGKAIINTIIILPLIVPALVTAIAMYRVLSEFHLTGTVFGFVIAHTIMAVPFVVVVVSAALRGINIEVERAAQNLGATRLTTVRLVVLPMVLPAMLSGGLLAFLLSFDELLIAIFISSPTVSTLPRKLWDGIRYELSPTLAAVSTLLLVVSIVVLILVHVLRRGLANRQL